MGIGMCGESWKGVGSYGVLEGGGDVWCRRVEACRYWRMRVLEAVCNRIV